MTKKLLIVVSALALVAAAPNLAIAKSVKNMISHQSLVQFCTTSGLGDFPVTLTLPSGKQMTGTVHCESEDIANAANGASHESFTPSHDEASSTEPGDDDASSAEAGDDDASDAPDDHGNASGSDDSGDDAASAGDDDQDGASSEEQHSNEDGGSHGESGSHSGSGGHHGGGDDN